MHLLCQANALRIPLADKSVHMCCTLRRLIGVSAIMERVNGLAVIPSVATRLNRRAP